MQRPTNLSLDDQLCYALYAATNAVVRAYRPLLARIGLTYPQYLAMLTLWQHGEQTVGAIATRLDLPAHGVGPLLHRLEAAGYLTLRREQPDRRVVNVALTSVGAELEYAAARAQETVACATGLTSTDLGALRTDLHALVARMAADGGTGSRVAAEAQPRPRRRAGPPPPLEVTGRPGCGS